jgi:hypothetical protein
MRAHVPASRHGAVGRSSLCNHAVVSSRLRRCGGWPAGRRPSRLPPPLPASGRCTRLLTQAGAAAAAASPLAAKRGRRPGQAGNPLPRARGPQSRCAPAAPIASAARRCTVRAISTVAPRARRLAHTHAGIPGERSQLSAGSTGTSQPRQSNGGRVRGAGPVSRRAAAAREAAMASPRPASPTERALKDRVEQLISKIRPAVHSEKRRHSIFVYVDQLIKRTFAAEEVRRRGTWAGPDGTGRRVDRPQAAWRGPASSQRWQSLRPRAAPGARLAA